MRLAVNGRVHEGRVVDVRDHPVTAERVQRALAADATGDVTADCPAPGVVHDRVGVPVTDHTNPWLRGALAAAARSLGERATQRDRIEATRAQLADHDAETLDVEAARRRVAQVGESEARLRERVATLRGRAEAFDEAGVETARVEASSALDEAVSALTTVETERIAAEQRLAELEERARSLRDRRERRLALEDRLANLQRAARKQLATTVYDRFRAAVEALPGTGTAGDGPGGYTGDGALAALAVVRIAAVEAPVVLGTDRLDPPESAARRLDAPVVRARPSGH